jgi:hypothetical protein
MLDRRHTRRLRGKGILLTGDGKGGDGRGAKAYDFEKAEYSINKSFNTVGYYLSKCLFFIRGIFLFFSMYILYSKLLHLPPFRFRCVGGCWIEPRTVATLALAVRRSNHSTRSHPPLTNIFRYNVLSVMSGGKFEVNRVMARGDGEKRKKW